jgi:hypothetical protein
VIINNYQAMAKTLQFKITLKRSDPKIWRRFHIDDSLTFYDLHLVIQNLMGWTNSHLYEFVYERNSTIGDPELLDRDDVADAKDVKLSAIFDKPKMQIQYEYDFGDSWNHELVLEKIADKNPEQIYPVCLAGELNCSPEDCGGIHGFYQNLEILKNKKHPEYHDTKEWMGDYDPLDFDLQALNEILKNYKDIEMDFDL